MYHTYTDTPYMHEWIFKDKSHETGFNFMVIREFFFMQLGRPTQYGGSIEK